MKKEYYIKKGKNINKNTFFEKNKKVILFEKN